jgi:hypothetical protein
VAASLYITEHQAKHGPLTFEEFLTFGILLAREFLGCLALRHHASQRREPRARLRQRHAHTVSDSYIDTHRILRCCTLRIAR